MLPTVHTDRQSQEPLLPHEVPNRPWNKVAVDLFQFRNKDFLIAVDYYSGFYEIKRMQTTRASAVIQVLKSQFACHGIPQTVVSDNGPQHTCDEFKFFAAAWKFHHVTSCPRHPKSNGRVEAAVKACKSLIKKTEESGEDVQLALLAARNTPVEGLDASPVQLLFARRTRSLLPQHCSLLQPSTPKNIATKRTKIKRKQKYYHDRNALAKPLPDIPVGDVVRMRLPGQSTWSTGICTKKLPYRSYHVFAGGATYRRNRRNLLVIPADQPESPIVEVSPKPSNMTAEPDVPAQMPQSSKGVVPTSTSSTSSCVPTRKSQRSVRKPVWHADYQT